MYWPEVHVAGPMEEEEARSSYLFTEPTVTVAECPPVKVWSGCVQGEGQLPGELML